jgi:hypothetical protein
LSPSRGWQIWLGHALLAVIGDVRRFEPPEKLVPTSDSTPASVKAERANPSNSALAKENKMPV